MITLTDDRVCLVLIPGLEQFLIFQHDTGRGADGGYLHLSFHQRNVLLQVIYFILHCIEDLLHVLIPFLQHFLTHILILRSFS